MFSGIVEEKGKVESIARTAGGCKLTVESKVASKDAKIGDSISINGVCLSVVGIKNKNLSFDVMEETLRRTNLTDISVNNSVNLERALKLGDKLSGHFVTGHVDCIGKINKVTKQPNNYALEIELAEDKIAYVAEKGSIAIDGVSLTVAEIKNKRIKVCLIPLTLKTTNLDSRKIGDSVNIEFDILGKYSLNKPTVKNGKLDVDFLKEHGFI